MKVYLLETGCYEDRWVEGVYATPEAAMAAHSPKRPEDHRGVMGHEYREWAGRPWSYEWAETDDGKWSFGADWDHPATIRVFEVEG